jgi:hypothetical protein
MYFSAATALRASEILASIGVLISSSEFLIRPRMIDDSSLMSWPVFRLRHRWFFSGFKAAALDGALAFPRFLWIMRIRAGAAVAVIAVPMGGPIHVAVLGIVVLGTAALMLRTTYGLEGSDQLVLIVFIALTLVALRPTVTAMQLGLWFITLQACLAYFTAGIYKVTSPVWWDGGALTGVLGTLSYGNPRLASWFVERTRTTKWSSRVFSLTEAAFPLVLICPPTWMPYFLAWGVGFHVACAVIMGLNNFVWAFVATYPAIAYCVLR